MGVIVYPRIGNHNGLPLFRYQSPKTSSQIKRPKQSISRILFRAQVTLNRATIIHLRMPIARHLLRPTRELGRATLKCSPIWSCTRWGLPSFPGHPGNWCALTAPFHPYPSPNRTVRCRAVYFLLHFPSRHHDSTLWSTLPCGVRTFLWVAVLTQRSFGLL